MKSTQSDRRKFIKNAATAAAGLVVLPPMAKASYHFDNNLSEYPESGSLN
jgi:hypothetical protein